MLQVLTHLVSSNLQLVDYCVLFVCFVTVFLLKSVNCNLVNLCVFFVFLVSHLF